MPRREQLPTGRCSGRNDGRRSTYSTLSATDRIELETGRPSVVFPDGIEIPLDVLELGRLRRAIGNPDVMEEFGDLDLCEWQMAGIFVDLPPEELRGFAVRRASPDLSGRPSIGQRWLIQASISATVRGAAAERFRGTASVMTKTSSICTVIPP
jgi:hypothetical protein